MMLSPGYIHCHAHPDHGEPVTYCPGQALPEWVENLLAEGATLRPVKDRVGEFDLVVLPSKRGLPQSATPRKQVKR
jgi:hypothetical protein